MESTGIVYGGPVAVGDSSIRDAQARIGATSDGVFYRTAILVRGGVAESIDIIHADGTLLARLNISATSQEYPSIDVITLDNRRQSIRVWRDGRTLHEFENPTSMTSVIFSRRE